MAAIYTREFALQHYVHFNGPYILSNLTEGCSLTNSLLLSTLKCFYMDSDCLSILLYFAQASSGGYFSKVPNFHFRPLIYNASSSRFPPHTSIETIVKAIMIEDWNHSYSYKAFYESCAPTHCTYSEKRPIKIVVKVITGLISIIGCLSFVIRLITPYLIKCIVYLWTVFTQRQQPRARNERECNGERGIC